MITIELKSERFSSALARLDGGLDDMSELMADIGEYLVESTKRRFVEGKGPDGAPWAPKSEATKEAYRRRKDPAPDRPLWGPSGRLRREVFAQPGPRSVEVGSSLIYAAVQQFGAARGAFGRTKGGAPIPWGAIPARPFLGLSAEDDANLADIVEEWLEGLAGD
jgi:phage virion morphogenesis protein